MIKGEKSDRNGRSQTVFRFFTWLIYGGACLALVLLIRQNRSLRQDVALLKTNHTSEGVDVAARGFQGGDRPATPVFGENSKRIPWSALGEGSDFVVWCFDPDCGKCAEEAPLVAAALEDPRLAQSKIVCVSANSREKASKFLDRFGIHRPLFTLLTPIRERKAMTVPQLLRMDSCGTVIEMTEPSQLAKSDMSANRSPS